MYTLDQEAAKQADTRSARIDETGAYTGVIVRAVEIPANANGTKGIELEFKSDAGQDARLPLYTHNGKGETLPAFKIINAVMTCCRIRSLTPSPATVKRWDYDAQKEIDKQVNVFAEIAGKRCGLFIEMESSEYQGKMHRRPVLVGAYEAGTFFTAKEILDKATKPETFEKFAASLHDRKSKNKIAAPQSSGPSRAIPLDADDPFGDSNPF